MITDDLSSSSFNNSKAKLINEGRDKIMSSFETFFFCQGEGELVSAR